MYCHSIIFFLKKPGVLVPWRQNFKLLCYPTPLFKAPADSFALGAFSAGGTLTRLGRRTNSPRQFGHRHSKAAVQCGQNVHSYVQIKAR
jgi:hypothetical protein